MSGDEEKTLQRKAGMAARKGLAAELRERKSKAITENIISLSAYKNARTILSYQPFGAEVDTTPLNQIAAGDKKRLAYPISEAGGILLPAIPERG